MTVKVVNVYPKFPITTVNPPIRATVKHVRMPEGMIRNCILAHATVQEILPDGSTVILTMGNYNTDNTPKAAVEVTVEPVSEPVQNYTVQTEPVTEEEVKTTVTEVDTSGMTKKQRKEYYRKLHEQEKQASQVQPAEEDKEPVVETAELLLMKLRLRNQFLMKFLRLLRKSRLLHWISNISTICSKNIYRGSRKATSISIENFYIGDCIL